jgi:cyclic 2,3-diphosphoglycerate synthetase
MVSANLADRAALERDLDRAPRYDVLLTELKAAAVDVAARHARARGADVVFVDNRPAGVPEGSDGDIDRLLLEVAGLARGRAEARA